MNPKDKPKPKPAQKPPKVRPQPAGPYKYRRVIGPSTGPG